MSNRPFVAAANNLLARYQPRCTSLAFNPHSPFGHFTDEFGETSLNLGAPGATLIMSLAEEVTESDVDAVFAYSADRDGFWRWAKDLKHRFDRTMPDTAEQRALKALDEAANADLYQLMGLAGQKR
jgi:hypothetical protein